MKFTRRMVSFMLVVAMFFAISALSVSAAGTVKYGIGFTTGSSLRLRSEPSTSCTTLAYAAKGEVVVVIDQVGEWYHVIYNLKEGYMHKNYVSVLTRENAELGYGKINGTCVNLRSGPGTSYSVVAVGSRNDQAYIIGINNGWYKVIYNSRICYIRSDYLDLTEIPYENKASAKSPIFFRGGKSTGTPVSASALKGGSTNTGSTGTTGTTTGSVSGNKIIDFAKQYLGVPYRWGGASPSGFDCSGFVYYVFNNVGITLPRSLAQQQNMGVAVAKSDLQPGDVVYFQNTYAAGISHVGIYVGGGKFIHAPSSGKVVSYADLNSNYYVQHYYGARRFS